MTDTRVSVREGEYVMSASDVKRLGGCEFLLAAIERMKLQHDIDDD